MSYPSRRAMQRVATRSQRADRVAMALAASRAASLIVVRLNYVEAILLSNA
jgi:hypothetical protein